MEEEKLRIVLKNGEVLLADSVSEKMKNDILFFLIPLSMKDGSMYAMLYRYDAITISKDAVCNESILRQMKEFCLRIGKYAKFPKSKRKFKSGRNIINLIVANWDSIKDQYKFSIDVGQYS